MILSAWNSHQRARFSHVLLYHSIYSHIPGNLKLGLHNVTPDILRRQLLWLKKYFDPVSIDDFVADWKPGRFAVTFDDGYQSVFDEAVDVLDELKIPATVFVNGCSLEGQPFWRDQIRFLINRGWIADFLEVLRKRLPDVAALLTVDNFYRMTKNPRVNSRVMDGFLTEFLADKKIAASELIFCITDPARFRPSRFITLGNHSWHHYVLSSLTEDEQETEIRGNQRILERLGLPQSKIFSIPFGGDDDFNTATLRIISRCGFTGFLYSRNRLNKKIRTRPSNGTVLRAAERYMVADTFRGFQKHIFRLRLKAMRDA